MLMARIFEVLSGTIEAYAQFVIGNQFNKSVVDLASIRWKYEVQQFVDEVNRMIIRKLLRMSPADSVQLGNSVTGS